MVDTHFEKMRDYIRQELLKAKDHYAMFWQLNEGLKIYKVADGYPLYFYYSLLAHDNMFIISIHNVIHDEKGTANFPRLFTYILGKPELLILYPEDRIETMKRKFDYYTELFKLISHQRNKHIAHHELNVEPLKELPIYKKEEGEKLIVDLNNLLNEISERYDNKSTDIFNWIPHYKCQEVLQHLQEYRQWKGLS